MKIIGTAEGLKREEFMARGKEVLKAFEKDWGEWPAKIEAMGK